MAGMSEYGDVAARVAAQHRIWMSGEAAEAIAVAVLGYADGTYHVRRALAPELAGNADAMVSLSKSMRRELAFGLMDAGVLPVALPSQTVTADRGYPWDMTDVLLTVPVRTPLEVPQAEVVLDGGYYHGARLKVPDSCCEWLMPEPPGDRILWQYEPDPAPYATGRRRHLLYRWRGAVTNDGARMFHLDG